MKIKILDNFLNNYDFERLTSLNLQKVSSKHLKVYHNKIKDDLILHNECIDKKILLDLNNNYHSKALNILKEINPAKVSLYDYSEFQIIETGAECKFPTHDDTPNKLLSGVVYLKPNENSGTVFYSKTNTHVRLKVGSDNGMGIIVSKDQDIFFLNIYANLDFNPVDPPLLGYIAAYVSHIRRRENAEHIIIAGDFNMDRRMDENPTGSVFAKKGTYPTNNFFDAILDLGFHDCMRKFNSEPVQTHRNARSEFPWELDHMFVTPTLYKSLTKIDVIAATSMSDHDPIVADFEI